MTNLYTESSKTPENSTLQSNLVVVKSNYWRVIIQQIVKKSIWTNIDFGPKNSTRKNIQKVVGDSKLTNSEAFIITVPFCILIILRRKETKRSPMKFKYHLRRNQPFKTFCITPTRTNYKPSEINWSILWRPSCWSDRESQTYRKKRNLWDSKQV